MINPISIQGYYNRIILIERKEYLFFKFIY